MTIERKNKMLEAAYDLCFELERINEEDYDTILDNGGKVYELINKLDDFRLALCKVKTN